MKVLVVGLGSAGRRHTKNLKTLDPAVRIAVWRPHSRTADLNELQPMVEHVVYCEEDALAWEPEVAIVSTPASLHIQTGLTLARSGVHLFIEKPLSDTMTQVDELLRLCGEHRLVLMVGYNLRFCEPLRIMRRALGEGRIGRIMTVRAEAGQYLPDWRPRADYCQTVSARRDLGGGVLLELSHELDYLRWFIGEVKGVSAQLAHLSDLDIDVEDTAVILLRFGSGVLGSVHLDMVQRPGVRTCRVVGTKGTLVWDGVTNGVQLFSVVTNTWLDLHPKGAYDRNEMYLAELRHFLDCVRGNKDPIVGGDDGRRVLEIALAAKQSAQEQRAIAI